MEKIDTYLGWKVNFAEPRGEPAMLAPDSMGWRVYKNPVALAVGGVCAVLLEFADARIRSGVWDHSVFKTDPIGRSRRTGMAAMIGVYGPARTARRVIQGVTNMHARVEGQTPGGERYRALDPELLDWVGATAAFGFLTAYDRFVTPLGEAEKRRFFAEGREVASLYGVKRPLTSVDDFMEMLRELEPRFEPHPINTEFLDIMKSGRAAPGVPKAMQSAVVHAAVTILPPIVRERLKLGREYDLHRKGELFVKAMGQVAERVPNKTGPAAQACERVGLPRDFLWQRAARQRRLLAAASDARTVQPAE